MGLKGTLGILEEKKKALLSNSWNWPCGSVVTNTIQAPGAMRQLTIENSWCRNNHTPFVCLYLRQTTKIQINWCFCFICLFP